MEFALNLGWAVLTLLLCGLCLAAARFGKLRLSLPAAFGCTLLLAVLLFPAISMTDDLQRADYALEQRARHLIYLAPVPVDLSFGLLVTTLVLILLAVCCTTRLRLQLRLRFVIAGMEMLRTATPLQVRPPTGAAAA
ncbi:hypothetical protein [Terriglobus sp.]|uniref:hypothetical protein n=1 Tax=Terriglobus sp. TaxID=1889013 RepID=UPI003B006336